MAVGYLASSSALLTGVNDLAFESYPYTQLAAKNRVGVVCYANERGAGLLDTCEWEGVAMTRLGNFSGKPAGSPQWPNPGAMQLFYILEADFPADGSIDIDFTSSGTFPHGVATVAIFEGCAQEAPSYQGGTVDSGVTVNPTLGTDVNGMSVLFGFSSGGSMGGEGAGQTVLFDGSYSSSTYTHYFLTYEAAETSPSFVGNSSSRS